MSQREPTSQSSLLSSSARQQIIDGLSTADESMKALQSFIQHCSADVRLSTESKQSLEVLRDFVAAQHRPLQNVRRIWTTLGTRSRPTPGLTSATEILLRVSDTLTTLCEPLRSKDVSDELKRTTELWRRLSTSAASFTRDFETAYELSTRGSDSSAWLHSSRDDADGDGQAEDQGPVLDGSAQGLPDAT